MRVNKQMLVHDVCQILAKGFSPVLSATTAPKGPACHIYGGGKCVLKKAIAEKEHGIQSRGFINVGAMLD